MAEIMKKKKVVGEVRTTLTEGYLYLHEQLANGEIEGRKFTVNTGGGFVYVQIDGVKGTLPKIGVFLEDLVQAAYATALKEKLFE